MISSSCSDGFFFAVKEVSLLDQGSQGKQSIFQLQQVGELILLVKAYCILYIYVFHFSWEYLIK